jgi:hypothetical protein
MGKFNKSKYTRRNSLHGVKPNVTTIFSSLHATFLDGILFPYTDLKFPFLCLPEPKKNIFPHIRALSVIQEAYRQVSPLQPTYIGFSAQN